MRTFYSLRLYVVLVFLFLANMTYADNKNKLRTYNSQVKDFFNYVFNNPANMTYYSSLSYSEINSGWILDDREGGFIAQDGNKESAFNFNALSFIRKDDKTFFGSLFYDKGNRENVGWNQTSDYYLLYPYVIVNKNSIDVDFEKYSFDGGYAVSKKNINIGIWANYTAKYEYSTSDPRPKNVVSKYDIKMGMSVKFSKNYLGGIFFEIESYKQKNEIKIFRENEKSKFFFMRGFGLYNSLFSKNRSKTASIYEGLRYGVEIQLLPLKGQGFYSSVGGNVFNFDQDALADNVYVNLFLMKNISGAANIGYKYKFEDNSYCFNLHADIRRRNGTEYIYEEVSSSNYLLITSHDKYSENNFKVGFSSLVSLREKERISYWFKAQGNYCIDNTKYLGNIYKQKETTGQVYLCGGINSAFKKSYLDLHLSVGYNKNINSEIKIPKEGLVEGIGEDMLMHNFRYLTSDKTFVNINLRYDYYISDTKTLFIKGIQQIERIKEIGNNNVLNIALGLTF